MRSNYEIAKLWNSYGLCEDFSPVLNELMNHRDDLEQKLKIAFEALTTLRSEACGGLFPSTVVPLEVSMSSSLKRIGIEAGKYLEKLNHDEK